MYGLEKTLCRVPYVLVHSGGNLAAILTHKAALMEPPVPMIFQVLVVPVTDATTDSEFNSVYPSWLENAKGPCLAPARMLWFINFYLPDPEDRKKWDSSPMFAPDQTFAKAPNAWIGLGECDILRDEGMRYGEKLKSFGKEVEIVVYKGAPHPIMAMDGKCFIPF
jgi:acetyl esterase/lipase